MGRNDEWMKVGDIINVVTSKSSVGDYEIQTTTFNSAPNAFPIEDRYNNGRTYKWENKAAKMVRPSKCVISEVVRTTRPD